ncbi:MAG: sugar ABC transporter permease [Chloroflexota bacterium]|nr:sugar ABC transporter permease [Chloroflexota bacterium]
MDRAVTTFGPTTPRSALARAARRKRVLVAYLFLLPFLVPFLLLWVAPIVEGLYLGFTNSSLLEPESRFVGLDNYRRLVSDTTFRESLGNTLVFVVENVPILMIAGLVLALMLNEPLHGRAAIRGAFVAPYLITGSAVAIAWQFMLNPTTGILNRWLGSADLPTQRWLNEPGQAMWVVTAITLWWRVGFPLLVILAALQDVPQDLYEAAKIDGASAFQRFRSITLPLITPVLIFVLIIRLIDSFKVFAQVYLVTEGGPFGSTRVVLQYLYERGFQDYQTGYAAAIGWMLFLIILIVTLIQLVVLRRVETYD